MTMRLDIVTNDAGELVRREHARELGAGVVVAIYRMAKLAQVHDLANQAFLRQLEQTLHAIGEYCLRSGANVGVLFQEKAVFVNGQLLKGSRGAYEAAAELGQLLERLGGSELFIQRDVTREELFSFAEQFSLIHRNSGHVYALSTPKIRLRAVSDAARVRGIDLEDLTEDQRIVRMYASAVVIMRRFFEDLLNSKYILPRRIKRIAQSLVDLSEGSTLSFLGVTEARNANFDEAGRAVNTAILAVSMAREATHDKGTLAQIAMAAMMHDVARPRAMALASAAGSAMPGMAGPSTLSEDQEDRLAAGSAAVLTALGRVNEPSITRTVLTFEALWLRRQTWLGPVYWGLRGPTIHAKIIAIARRYNDLLTPEPGLMAPTPDYAVAVLSDELKDPIDRTVLRLLVASLGLLPMGTTVQLATGEVAEVLRGPRGAGEKARVRILQDPNGQPQNLEVELAQDPRRTVARVLGVDGWRKGLALRPGADGVPDDDPHGDYQVANAVSAPPPQHQQQQRIASMNAPAVEGFPSMPPLNSPQNAIAPPPAANISDQYAAQYAQWGTQDNEPPSQTGSGQSAEHNSSASLPSMGSSPSAVAEAMGRMINDSLRPPAVLPPGGAERTVFQHGNTSPEEIAERVTNVPQKPQLREPTARGTLAATPLPHVLVYMLDHLLTGSVVFEGGAGEESIYFVGGVPAKIRLQEPIALLGEILAGGGVLEQSAVDHAVDGARRLGILLGEYLVGHDLVTREQLEWALEAQLLHKIAHLANLPPELTYAYYRDADLLEGWGGGDFIYNAALNPILASVRNWLDRARVRATLNRIGKHPLVIHEETDLTSLALLPEEQVTLDVIRAETPTLTQLYKRNIADEETVSSLVYALAVTRQFAFKGQKKGPMLAKPVQPARKVPSSSGARATNVASGPVATGNAPSSSKPEQARAAKPSVREMAAVNASSASPNEPVRKPSVRDQAAAALPPAASPPRRASDPRMPVATAQAAAPQPPTPAPRAIAPAARPGASTAGSGALARASAPQVRIAKKSTMVGIQPINEGNAGGDGKPASVRRQPVVAPAPTPDGASDTVPPGGIRVPMPSSPPDDAVKTIAMMSPVRARGIPNPLGGKFPVGAGNTRPAAGKPASAPQPAPTPPTLPDTDVSGDESDGGGADDPGMAEAQAALEAMRHFRLAEAALNRNDPATAEILAQKAVQADPSQDDYHWLLAWIRGSTGDEAALEQAIVTMSQLLDTNPANDRALLSRARLLGRGNRFQEAVDDLNSLLAVNPQNREAAAELADLESRM